MVGAWRPDVIVRESQELAGALAAERHGIPHVRVALGLAGAEEETLAQVAAPVRELCAEHALPAERIVERLRDAPCFTIVPEALDEPWNSVGVHRFREVGGARAPDPWPGGDDPLVYVTFGSVAASLGYFPGLFGAACEALADLPARVLVTIGADPAALGALPRNVRVERWIAQERIAPYAAAVVCHGGYGSVLGALVHGVPLVLMALFGGDQRRNARRVAEIGAGIRVEDDRRAMFDPPGHDAIAALAGAVRRVLEEQCFRDAARRVAADIESLPPVDGVAGLLRAL